MTLLLPILAAVTLAGAVAAMALRNLIHCALALTIAFAGLATLYLSLNAEFAGLAQLLVYVGAIAILIVFAVLLTPAQTKAEADAESKRALTASGIIGCFLALGVFAIFAWAILHSELAPIALAAPQATMRQIGEALMQRYVLPIEIIGLMLTAALIGAVILAMKENHSPR